MDHTHRHGMTRVVLSFALAGGIIPLILVAVEQVELYLNVYKSVPVVRYVWYYLWPPSVALGAAYGLGGLVLVIGVVLTVIENILLYTLAGLIVGFVWRVASKHRMS